MDEGSNMEEGTSNEESTSSEEGSSIDEGMSMEEGASIRTKRTGRTERAEYPPPRSSLCARRGRSAARVPPRPRSSRCRAAPSSPGRSPARHDDHLHFHLGAHVVRRLVASRPSATGRSCRLGASEMSTATLSLKVSIASRVVVAAAADATHILAKINIRHRHLWRRASQKRFLKSYACIHARWNAKHYREDGPRTHANAVAIKKVVKKSHLTSGASWQGICAVLGEALQSRRRGGICVEEHHKVCLQPHEAARRALLPCGTRGGGNEAFASSGKLSFAERSRRPFWRR